MKAPAPLGPTSRDWLTARLACDEITPATFKSYSAHLAIFARHVGDDRPIDTITARDFEGWLAAMGVQPSTKMTRMATLRAFFAWAAEPGPEQLIDHDPTKRVRRPRLHKRPLQLVADEDLKRVLTIAKPRDRVLLVIALQTGLRRGELAGLRIEDWDRRNRQLYVRGKGLKDRRVPVPREATVELAHWVGSLGRRSGPLFPSDKRPGHGLAEGTISHIVRKAGVEVGVKLKTHDLRRKCLSDAAANGATSFQLKEFAGHAYSSTTDKYYIKVGEEAVARAVEGRNYRPRPHSAAAN